MGITLFTSALGQAGAADFNYRYYKFQTTNTLNGGTAIQFSEFKFLSGTTRVVPVLPAGGGSGAVTITPAGDSPANEGPDKLVDNNTGTKWFNFGNGTAPAGGRRAVVFDFGTGSAPVVNAYTFTTAQGGTTLNGENGRNPKSWTLEGSNDGSSWTLLDVRVNYPTPLAATTELAPPFEIPAFLPPVISSFSALTPVVVNGGTTDLSWQTDYVDTVTLTPGGSPGLAVDGAATVTPPFTAGQVTDTVYTLEADSAAADPVTDTLTVRTVPGGSVSGQYVRFTPLFTGLGQIQLADLRFYGEGLSGPEERVPTGVLYADGSAGTGTETPDKLRDANPGTKWFSGTLVPVVFNFGTVQAFDTYAFTLAGDAAQYAGRNPLKWKMEVSDDGSVWDVIEDFSAFDYPMPAANGVVVTVPLPGYQLAPPPVINFFRAKRDTSLTEDPIVFSWDVLGADSVTITPGAGEPLSASGTLEYVPTAAATYTLTAVSGGGTVTKSVSFGMIAPSTGLIHYADFSTAGDEFVLLGAEGSTPAELVNDSPQIPQPGDKVRLRLTPDLTDKRGVAWFNQRVPVGFGFDTTFGMQMTCAHRGYAAEGMSFVIQNTAEGLAATPLDNGPAANALTVKFSAWDNPSNPSNEAKVNLYAGSGNKIFSANVQSFPAISLRGPAYGTFTGPVTESPYTVRVVYAPGDLDVYIDGVQVITDFNVDLAALGAVDGAGTAYLGFVGRTGGLEQAHDVTRWTLASATAPLTLATSSIDAQAGTASFSWVSKTGLFYRITASPDLADWTTVLKQNIPSAGAMTTDSVTFTPGTKLFFRIEEE